jgi:hypothetical protein
VGLFLLVFLQTRILLNTLVSRTAILVAALVVAAAICVVPRLSNRAPEQPAAAHPDDATYSAEVPSGMDSNPPSVIARVSADSPWQTLDDPNQDGWPSETRSERALARLNELADLLRRPERITVARIDELTTGEFASDPLLPQDLAEVYRDRLLVVSRAHADRADDHRRDKLTFVDQLRSWSDLFADRSRVTTKFKVIEIGRDGPFLVTRQLGSVAGRTRGETRTEQHFTWRIHWKVEGDARPRFSQIELEDFEQVMSYAPSASTLFNDCTDSALGKNRSYRDQFLYGFNHWLERIQDIHYYSMLGTPGLAIGDVDGDGLEDLFVSQEGGLPNRLFVHEPDGTAKDVSAAASVDWLERTRGALLLDLDNDGDQDLAAALLGCVVVAANDGRGQFDIQTVLPCGHDTMSLASADYDNDGDLDIYVCVHNPNDASLDAESSSLAALNARIVYHDANNAGPNALFRNDISGDQWRFHDATEEVGLHVNNRRFSFAASWEDYDNDGDQDLYVANDFGRNNLYRNELSSEGRARFVDVAAETNTEDSASGMSVAWSDFDRDGWLDLYIGNMFSAAGNRITRLDQFKPQAAPTVRGRLQRFARGNTLLRNQGGRAFEDVSVAANVTMGRWAWSSNFVDINNDGWDDLVVANGFITGRDSGDL